MEELIDKAKKGDKEAFTELIISIQKELYAISTIKLDNIEDRNDAIQETMLKAFKNIKKLRESSAFKSWIIKILINECNKVYIKKYKKKMLFEKLLKTKDYLEYNNDIEIIENNIDFKLIINKLNYEEQLIITLYFSSKLSIAEIAKVMNIKYDTAKTKLYRTEEKIKRIMRKEDDFNE